MKIETITWTDKLEYLAQKDKETEPKSLKSFISEDNELLESVARKLTSAVNHQGYAIAKNIISKYWVNMSSAIGFNDDVSGYFTSLTIDRETTTGFTYTFYTIVTSNGILLKRGSTAKNHEGSTFGDDGLGKIGANFVPLSIEDAKSMENNDNVRAFVDSIMNDFVESFELFLKTIKDIVTT